MTRSAKKLDTNGFSGEGFSSLTGAHLKCVRLEVCVDRRRLGEASAHARGRRPAGAGNCTPHTDTRGDVRSERARGADWRAAPRAPAALTAPAPPCASACRPEGGVRTPLR